MTKTHEPLPMVFWSHFRDSYTLQAIECVKCKPSRGGGGGRLVTNAIDRIS